MVWKLVAAVGVFLSFSLYCCLRVGAQEDRRMEEWREKKQREAGEESG